MKGRSPAAYALALRGAGRVMKHRNTPRGGRRNLMAETLAELEKTCSCGSRGWEPRIGYRASGESFQGCEFCVGDEGIFADGAPCNRCGLGDGCGCDPDRCEGLN